MQGQLSAASAPNRQKMQLLGKLAFQLAAWAELSLPITPVGICPKRSTELSLFKTFGAALTGWKQEDPGSCTPWLERL